VNIEELMRICLEFDKQQLTSRPSAWGRAAETLLLVARAAEPTLGAPLAHVLGNYKSVVLSQIRKPNLNGDLEQPLLSLVDQVEHWQVKAKAAGVVLSLIAGRANLTGEQIADLLNTAESSILFTDNPNARTAESEA
jgi:hypothetical protein